MAIKREIDNKGDRMRKRKRDRERGREIERVLRWRSKVLILGIVTIPCPNINISLLVRSWQLNVKTLK